MTDLKKYDMNKPVFPMWAVMKAHSFSGLVANGIPLKPSPGEPSHFIPLFASREKAVAWAKSPDHVVMVGMDEEIPCPECGGKGFTESFDGDIKCGTCGRYARTLHEKN